MLWDNMLAGAPRLHAPAPLSQPPSPLERPNPARPRSKPPRQLSPGLTWTAEVLEEAAEQLPAFTPTSLAMLLLALGIMGVKPNKEWMGPVLERARVLLK